MVRTPLKLAVVLLVGCMVASGFSQIKADYHGPWKPERTQAERAADQGKQGLVGEVGSPTINEQKGDDGQEVIDSPQADQVLQNFATSHEKTDGVGSTTDLRHDSVVGSDPTDPSAPGAPGQGGTNWLVDILIGVLVIGAAFFGLPALINRLGQGAPKARNF